MSPPNNDKVVAVDWSEINKLYPIAQYQKSKNGRVVRLKREGPKQGQPPTAAHRGKIEFLSRKSLSRLAFTAQAASEKFKSILTLTYSGVPRDGVQVKSDLNYILQLLRYRCGNMQYLWWLEFQRRGSPHFHILLSCEVDRNIHLNLSKKWAKRQNLPETKAYEAFCVTYHKDSWQNLRSVGGAAGYVTSYATKRAQKIVPQEYQDVGRFWGASRGLLDDMLEDWQETDHSEIKAMMHDNRPDIENWEFYPKHISLHKVDKSRTDG